MLGWSLKRLLSAIPTLFLLITVAFFLMRAAPGGPLDSERELPQEVRAQIEAAYGLDRPLWRQYLDYLSRLAHADLGPSYCYPGFTVNELIAKGFPISFAIGSLALLLALLVGGWLGMLAAWQRNRWADRLCMLLATLGLSIPNFVFAPLCILLFAVVLGWLPAGGWGWRHPASMLLPVLAMALPQIAIIARLLRASMIEVLGSEFIRVARSKGLPERHVLLHHALKPALLPVVSWLGPAAAALITGSVVIEQIFSIPGLGRFFVQGALNRDYTVVMGVVVFYGVLVVLFNFLVDLVYAWLDPRIRFG